MINVSPINLQEKQLSDIEKGTGECRREFDLILSEVLKGGQQEAHKMEASLFKRLMELGFLFLKLFFTSQNKGNYGKTIKTAKGIAQASYLFLVLFVPTELRDWHDHLAGVKDSKNLSNLKLFSSILAVFFAISAFNSALVSSIL